MSLPPRGVYENAEHYFNRLIDEKGFLNLTPLEDLSIELFSELRGDMEILRQEAREAEYERDEYENRADYAEERIGELERDNEMLHELSTEADETTQDDEVEFLKRLVRDLEDELAAIDAEAVVAC